MPAEARPAREEVEQCLAMFAMAFNGNAAVVASFYAENAALLPDGRPAIETYWKTRSAPGSET